MSDSDIPKDGSPPPEWLLDLLRWVGSDPWDFITKLLLILSPLFMISAFLAYKLTTMIDAKEKQKKQVSKRQKNLKNLRRAKND